MPHVAVEVYHDGVDARHSVEKCGEIVVVGNLCCPFFTFDAELFVEERLGETAPVNVRIGNAVCIEVTCCTAEFSAYRHLLQQFALTFDAVGKHTDFFTQASRRGRLSVSFCKHRNVFPFFCKCVQLVHHFIEKRQIGFVDGIADKHRNRGVVDVLRSKSEMDEFLVGIKFESVEFFLNEVFHSFYVVVCHAFNVFYLLCVLY